MYVLQIARFVANTLYRLTNVPHGAVAMMPSLIDFYRIYLNDDRTFRSKSTRSKYRS